jgi:pimeloyl-ACP methyl ester carboxylesterase
MTNSDDARELETGGYASVNGLKMYYEIHGTGEPLVLLHGAFSAIGTSFGELLPSFAESRQVIAFELQAHGRTADIDRPLSIEQLAMMSPQHWGLSEAQLAFRFLFYWPVGKDEDAVRADLLRVYQP